MRYAYKWLVCVCAHPRFWPVNSKRQWAFTRENMSRLLTTDPFVNCWTRLQASLPDYEPALPCVTCSWGNACFFLPDIRRSLPRQRTRWSLWGVQCYRDRTQTPSTLQLPPSPPLWPTPPIQRGRPSTFCIEYVTLRRLTLYRPMTYRCVMVSS